MITVRRYVVDDYKQIRALYKNGALFGGQFDEARDSRKKLAHIISKDPDSILVATDADSKIVGTVSLIEDGRVAWLFRFAVAENDHRVTKVLHEKACSILKERGHSQVIVYSPEGDQTLDSRYLSLGMNKGGEFVAYWQEL